MRPALVLTSPMVWSGGIEPRGVKKRSGADSLCRTGWVEDDDVSDKLELAVLEKGWEVGGDSQAPIRLNLRQE